jgi:site-specific recombinase XerD
MGVWTLSTRFSRMLHNLSELRSSNGFTIFRFIGMHSTGSSSHFRLSGVRLRKGAVEFAKSELVFPGRDGTPISNQAFNRRLATACRAAGEPIITAHGLRHSAANLLLNDKGRNLRELQELLGHRSMATTARYTHIDRERLRGVVAELEF